MIAGDTFGRMIQLFLVDGKTTGLRKATIHSWTDLLFVSGASAFAKTWSFNSPSAATAVVLDSNGWIEWQVKSSKQTYHDWQQVQAATPEATE
ncbi:DUF4357 domain-containing protein [Tritonibacter mobilis]|uniref:DUF4357 domain-containing protein n=1 Tax=Tritonibacter mobilis TaxID=379347 RepID=UPI000806D3C5|nr:DUF4357 domain-containing protein [Tritonibacter mobilis]